jgi:putative transcriptional regulator
MDLTGKILIAMPGMGDPRFEHSVVYMCAHSPEGAMGLIINKPLPDLDFSDLLNQLDIQVPQGDRAISVPVQFGGPVETGRGFVLHSGDWPGRRTDGEGTLRLGGGIAMTATRDILVDMAQGTGPQQAILALGYSGWGPGQLEDEILDNGWLTTDSSLDLVLGTVPGAKWEGALRSMGVEPLSLSSAAGHA